MKRIFAVMMALMMILSTTSQAYVVTIYGQNCTYTMTSPANREIIVNDTSGNVRWWKVEDTSNNIIGVINGTFVTPDKDVTVTLMTEGNQIIIQQTANGDIKYNGNAVNTIETTQGSNYTLTITPIEGGEINSVTVDGTELAESEITTSGMSYTFSNENENHIITATYTLFGDVDEDGEVEGLDIIKLSRYVEDTYEVVFTEQGKINADVNMDGKIDMYDVYIISMYSAGSYFDSLPYTGKVVCFKAEPNSSGVFQLFTTGETKALSPNSSITKEGYALIGWTTTAGGTTVEYADGANFTANANTTLYAVWNEL